MKLFLVACCAKKRTAQSRAEDLYCSPWFTLARSYVEKTSEAGDQWAILSAQYGLVLPHEEIEPYELSLYEFTPGQHINWLVCVINALHINFGNELPGATVVLLAGGEYRAHLADWLTFMGATVEVPMARLAIGRQLHWLKEQGAK